MSNSPSIITIGNFDGVHRGHQEILHAACRLAEKRDARVLAVTFDPFPVTVLRPEATPPKVASAEQRVEALKQYGADDVIVINPTPEVLSYEAPRFISLLREEHQAVGFVEGEDFRFGHKRGGDMTLLHQLGEEQGMDIRALPRVETRLSDQSVAPISSSLVRWLVGRGRVEDAAACMGRAYEIIGEIVKGEQRGRTIGVPTINISPDAYQGLITPMDGVYAGTAQLDNENQSWPAAISVGIKPTFGHDQLTIEAHLVGFKSDDPDALYGRMVRLSFDRWLRDQYPFPGVEELKLQLCRDIEAAESTHR